MARVNTKTIHTVSVEFVFAPPHERSCDPETTTKEDADHQRKIIEERYSEA